MALGQRVKATLAPMMVAFTLTTGSRSECLWLALYERVRHQSARKMNGAPLATTSVSQKAPVATLE